MQGGCTFTNFTICLVYNGIQCCRLDQTVKSIKTGTSKFFPKNITVYSAVMHPKYADGVETVYP